MLLSYMYQEVFCPCRIRNMEYYDLDYHAYNDYKIDKSSQTKFCIAKAHSMLNLSIFVASYFNLYSHPVLGKLVILYTVPFTNLAFVHHS